MLKKVCFQGTTHIALFVTVKFPSIELSPTELKSGGSGAPGVAIVEKFATRKLDVIVTVRQDSLHIVALGAGLPTVERLNEDELSPLPNQDENQFMT